MRVYGEATRAPAEAASTPVPCYALLYGPPSGRCRLDRAARAEQTSPGGGTEAEVHARPRWPRSSLLLALLLWVVRLAGPLFGSAPPAAAAAGLDFAIPGGHFYTEANGQGGAGGTGFSITDASGM